MMREEEPYKDLDKCIEHAQHFLNNGELSYAVHALDEAVSIIRSNDIVLYGDAKEEFNETIADTYQTDVLRLFLIFRDYYDNDFSYSGMSERNLKDGGDMILMKSMKEQLQSALKRAEGYATLPQELNHLIDCLKWKETTYGSDNADKNGFSDSSNAEEDDVSDEACINWWSRNIDEDNKDRYVKITFELATDPSKLLTNLLKAEWALKKEPWYDYSLERLHKNPLFRKWSDE